MSSKDKIDQALIAAAALKTPQAKILRRHFEAICLALDGGMKMAEVIQVLEDKTGIKLGLRWSYEVIDAERKKAKVGSVSIARPAKSDIAESRASAIASMSVTTPSLDPAPISQSTPTAASKPTSGWELEHQDDRIPPDLLKKAFVVIAGIKLDLRQPCPSEFGDKGEEIKHKVNPSSPNWPEYRARAQARTRHGQYLQSWHKAFKKWLISQGHTGGQN